MHDVYPITQTTVICNNYTDQHCSRYPHPNYHTWFPGDDFKIYASTLQYRQNIRLRIPWHSSRSAFYPTATVHAAGERSQPPRADLYRRARSVQRVHIYREAQAGADNNHRGMPPLNPRRTEHSRVFPGNPGSIAPPCRSQLSSTRAFFFLLQQGAAVLSTSLVALRGFLRCATWISAWIWFEGGYWREMWNYNWRPSEDDIVFGMAKVPWWNTSANFSYLWNKVG